MTMRDLILKRRMYVPEPILADARSFEEYQRCFGSAHSLLSSATPHLINVQSVMDDICSPNEDVTWDTWKRAIDYSAAPRPLPPFASVWMETKLCGQSLGIMVERIRMPNQAIGHYAPEIRSAIEEDKPKWVVESLVCVEWEGSCKLSSTIVYWLDDGDNFMRSSRFIVLNEPKSESGEPGEIDRHNRMVAKIHTSLILNAFARINCSNVQIKPRSNGRLLKRSCIPKTPPVVWSEIVVGAPPSVRHVPTCDMPQESIERRFHHVRGHYADYRKGKGLFGNPKLRTVFWFPEHHRGNLSAGEVRASYLVSSFKEE